MISGTKNRISPARQNMPTKFYKPFNYHRPRHFPSTFEPSQGYVHFKNIRDQFADTACGVFW